MSVYGGIETGGSKWECAIGSGPDDIRAAETIRTTTPGGLLGLVWDEVLSLMNGYLDSDVVRERMPEYITAPALGARAGVLGAIALAETA
jgi:predicted NBD/HSP70 family sugar kinase